jgi:hypothetical protein
LSGKAFVQDREEVDKYKGKDMNVQERKIRRKQDRKKRIVPRRNIGSKLREAS